MSRTGTHARTVGTQWRQRLALFRRIGRHLTHAVVQLFHERF